MEYVSYNDNHLGVFMTTEPKYAHQPWGASQPELKALHSDDENGAHFGSTPSVPTMADFQEHTVKIRYTRGFTTEKQGSGKLSTTDIVTADADRRRLKGNQLTKFKTELRTGFEFGYASRTCTRSTPSRTPTQITTSSRSFRVRFRFSSTTWTDTSSKSRWRIAT